MRQRAAVAAVSVLLGLAAVSPALAQGGSENAEKGKGGKGPTTTTTMGDGTDTSAPDGSSTSTTAAAADSAAADDSTTTTTMAATTTTMAAASATTGTTATTATTVPKNSCDPAQPTREPAPEPGQRKNYMAASSGDVDVERVNGAELRIAAANAAAGWAAEVNGPSGPRVAVRFTNTADPKNIVKFNASLNTDGSEIVIRVLNCRSNEPDAPEPEPADEKMAGTKP